MSEPIVSIDTSRIREGKLDDLKEAIVELVTFVESNEDRPIVYDIFLDQSGTLMTVVQVHPDSESMEHHVKVAGPAFAGFAELVTLSTLDVYGEPSEALLEQLRRKVQLLGPATLVVHDLQAGFARLRPALTSDHDSIRAVSRDALTFVTLPVRRLGSAATTTGVVLP